MRAFYRLPVEIQEGDVLDDKFSTRRRFWGLVYENLLQAWIQLDAYYLGLDDLSGNRDLQTFGFRGYRRPALDQLDYELELIGQLGEIGAKDQSAFSAHTDLGFTFALPWSPRGVAA